MAAALFCGIAERLGGAECCRMYSCWAFNQDVVNNHVSDLRHFCAATAFFRAAFFSCIAAQNIATMNSGTFFVLQVDLGMYKYIYIYNIINGLHVHIYIYIYIYIDHLIAGRYGGSS